MILDGKKLMGDLDLVIAELAVRSDTESLHKYEVLSELLMKIESGNYTIETPIKEDTP